MNVLRCLLRPRIISSRYSTSAVDKCLKRRVSGAAAAIVDPYSSGPDEFTLKLGDELVKGNRVALSRAITLIESSKIEDIVQAQHLLDQVVHLRRRKKEARGVDEKITSFRLGIAGPPGAGKSTFIEALGMLLIGKGHRVAVIAIDPSSARTGGSILGDKTRMTDLSKQKDAFVRPSPTRGALGGIAQHTNDVVLLCEAAHYDIVIVETVGLGQSEIQVDHTVDMLMLLVPPAGGDELQGVKKGIMEVADMVVVNKADGELASEARHTATEYLHALQLSRRKHHDWAPRVKRCSALCRDRIEDVWSIVEDFRHIMLENNGIKEKRLKQNEAWLWSQFHEQLKIYINQDKPLKEFSQSLKHELAVGLTTPRKAARELLKEFLTHQNHHNND